MYSSMTPGVIQNGCPENYEFNFSSSVYNCQAFPGEYTDSKREHPPTL